MTELVKASGIYERVAPEVWEADFTFKDGKWVDGMLEENFAGAMYRLRDACEEGLIDMEAVTNNTNVCRDKWYSGEMGIFSYWSGKWQTLWRNVSGKMLLTHP